MISLRLAMSLDLRCSKIILIISAASAENRSCAIFDIDGVVRRDSFYLIEGNGIRPHSIYIATSAESHSI